MNWEEKIQPTVLVMSHEQKETYKRVLCDKGCPTRIGKYHLTKVTHTKGCAAKTLEV